MNEKERVPPWTVVRRVAGVIVGGCAGGVAGWFVSPIVLGIWWLVNFFLMDWLTDTNGLWTPDSIAGNVWLFAPPVICFVLLTAGGALLGWLITAPVREFADSRHVRGMVATGRRRGVRIHWGERDIPLKVWVIGATLLTVFVVMLARFFS